jgi:ketosteroid isomerase-like protein
MKARSPRLRTVPTEPKRMPEDLDTARQFQSAAEAAFRSGDFDAVVALVAPDVECVTPLHSVHGADRLTEELGRARPSERFDVEFENGGWTHLGDGRFACELHVLYRSKVADNLSYSRDRSFELTIRDGKVSRYEMRLAD